MNSTFQKCMELFTFLAENYDVYNLMKGIWSDIDIDSLKTSSETDIRMLRQMGIAYQDADTG